MTATNNETEIEDQAEQSGSKTAGCYITTTKRKVIMNTTELMEVKEAAEIKAAKIGRLLDDKTAIERAIEDLTHLQKHAGEMIFTGNSGKVGEKDVLLKKVKINTLAGCVAVPKLLIELAQKRLIEIESDAEKLVI
jgi:phage terminase large subunit-like protein